MEELTDIVYKIREAAGGFILCFPDIRETLITSAFLRTGVRCRLRGDLFMMWNRYDNLAASEAGIWAAQRSDGSSA